MIMTNKQLRKLGKTHVTQTFPWGLFTRTGHRLLCSDGVIRSASMSQTADTFFSVPASIRIRGKTITGYATGEHDYDFATKTDYQVHAFRHHDGQTDKHDLPPWPSKFTPEHLKLVRDAA